MATSLATGWDGMANRNTAVRALDTLLRGAGQVFFQNNPLTGALVLAGILWAAIAAGSVGLFVGALIGLCGGTLTAVVLDVDKSAIRSGLFGFNGVLVGIAIPTFLAWNALTVVYIVITAVVVTVVTLAINTLVGTWGLPGSTGPFVFTTWLVLLAAHQFRYIGVDGLAAPALASQAAIDPALPGGMSAAGGLRMWLVGVSQVYLLNNIITALLFLAGIAFSSWRGALFALAGSGISVLVALLFGASGSAIESGLYGYDAVLTAMALGSVFLVTTRGSTVYALIGALFTAIVAAAMSTWLAPAGVPTFTSAYVLTMWLFLLPRKSTQIVGHEPVAESIFGAQK